MSPHLRRGWSSALLSANSGLTVCCPPNLICARRWSSRRLSGGSTGSAGAADVGCGRTRTD